MQPLVTVLVPAYNAEGTIRRALDSALAQDYPAIEIVVIDDASTDATSAIVAGFGRREIRLLRLAQNLGECGAMNQGLAIAKGKYIAFLDADDEWLPRKLSRQIPLLEGNPKAIMATCGCRFLDISGNVIRDFGMIPRGVAKGDIWRSLLAASCIAKPCTVVRSSAFREAGLFDTDLRVAGDQDMWIRLARMGEVEFAGEYLTLAHETPGSLTKVYGREQDKYVLKMIRGHIAALGSRLSDEEIRCILRQRYTMMGRNIYRSGSVWRGAGLLLKAIARGGNRNENLWYLVTASPPARFLKSLPGRVSGSRAKPRSSAKLRREGPTPDYVDESARGV